MDDGKHGRQCGQSDDMTPEGTGATLREIALEGQKGANHQHEIIQNKNDWILTAADVFLNPYVSINLGKFLLGLVKDGLIYGILLSARHLPAV